MCHALTQFELLLIADPPEPAIDSLLLGDRPALRAETVRHLGGWPGDAGWRGSKHARRVSLRADDVDDCST